MFYCKAQTLILQLIFSMPTAVAQLHQEHVVSPVCAYLTCIGRIWDFNSFELVEERSIYILYYLSLCVLIYDVWDNHSVLLVASSSVFLSHQISISHQSVLFFSRSKSTPANRTERIDSLIKVLNSLESVRLPLPVGARRRSPWSEMKKMRPFTRWQWVPVAGDARTPSLSEDGTKQGKALYIGVANLQAVGAWVIFCPAAVQPLLRRRGRLLAPPHRPAVRRRPCQRETRGGPARRQPPGSVSACSCSLMPARAAMFFSRT